MAETGSEYLYNLSIIAITFSAVSALVMLMRQTMGGKLSNFDVYLITSYISFGFTLSLMAVLPPLIALFELPHAAHWSVASGIAGILLGVVLAKIFRLRRLVSSAKMPIGVKIALGIHLFSVIALLANAAGWPWQGVHLFAGAITLSVADIMWTFVRRISSLFGDKPGEDWDPKRG